jgi:hypothetical protein
VKLSPSDWEPGSRGNIHVSVPDLKHGGWNAKVSFLGWLRGGAHFWVMERDAVFDQDLVWATDRYFGASVLFDSATTGLSNTTVFRYMGGTGEGIKIPHGAVVLRVECEGAPVKDSVLDEVLAW